MRLGNKTSIAALFAGAALLCAIPALSQDNPKSILPPGFGEPEPEPKPADDKTQKPVDLLPDLSLKSPNNSPSSSSLPRPTVEGVAPLDPTKPLTDEEKAALSPPVLQDLPASARRSTAVVGIIDPEDGGMGLDGFGRSNGVYLSLLMRNLRAPVASRWASILLRRDRKSVV